MACNSKEFKFFQFFHEDRNVGRSCKGFYFHSQVPVHLCVHRTQDKPCKFVFQQTFPRCILYFYTICRQFLLFKAHVLHCACTATAIPRNESGRKTNFLRSSSAGSQRAFPDRRQRTSARQKGRGGGFRRPARCPSAQTAFGRPPPKLSEPIS